MNDVEYDILDELYFIKTLAQLRNTFQNSNLDLEEEIWSLIAKKWVKALDESDTEILLSKEEYLKNCENLRFNATKTGLLVHNQI
ncbi:MAG TPA: hypothetical protein DCR46_09030 [Cytophagales bacterium]|nr:hypothetical protein [Cytophagales bacterium]